MHYFVPNLTILLHIWEIIDYTNLMCSQFANGEHIHIQATVNKYLTVQIRRASARLFLYL